MMLGDAGWLLPLPSGERDGVRGLGPRGPNSAYDTIGLDEIESRPVTRKLVRNHSHWGSFYAELEDGRVVGVKPFERDPEPSALIEAIPSAVYSQARVA